MKKSITARPAIYIDLILPDGSKQVFEHGVAKVIHQQLGMALASLDQASEQQQTPGEIDPQNELPLPGDLDDLDDDDLPLVAGVGHSRGA